MLQLKHCSGRTAHSGVHSCWQIRRRLPPAESTQPLRRSISRYWLHGGFATSDSCRCACAWHRQRPRLRPHQHSTRPIRGGLAGGSVPAHGSVSARHIRAAGPRSQTPYNPYMQGGQPNGQPGWSGSYGSVPPEANQKYNGLAIAGFICSFLVSLLGLILSIVGLNQIKKQGGKGKGLAIAGIIISAAAW